VRLTPQFLRALSRLGGRAFYEVIFLQTFYEIINFDDLVKSRLSQRVKIIGFFVIFFLF